jgi:hypothetical protein
MKYSDIQEIAIVYGTKDRIKTFLEANVQPIEEGKEQKINLRIIRNQKNSCPYPFLKRTRGIFEKS